MNFHKTIFYLYLILNCLSSFVYSEINLEEFTQDFILDTKKIIIPGYPHAFNPSITKWKGRWLMSFRLVGCDEKNSRLIPNISSASAMDVGLIYLDDELNPIGEAQFIFLDHPNKKRPYLLAEDARLIVNEERLYIIYSANKEAEVEDSGFRVYVAQLDNDEQNNFFVIHNECLSIFEGVNSNKREKNWTPFIYQTELLLSYQLFPHKIFRPLLDGSECCETVANSFPSLTWEWGELRGGTQALQLSEDYYLGIFHSSINLSTIHSNNQSIPHYFMGAYLFSSSPPFEIKYISPEPIIGTNFYQGLTYEPYWHPVCVVFPCGLVINEEDVWVIYGRQDHEIWIAKLDKKNLINSLIPISTLLE